MSAGKITEELVRKCFGDFICGYSICINGHHIQNLARAARRFVKAEQMEKLKLRMRRRFLNSGILDSSNKQKGK